MIVTELYNGQGLGNQLWSYVALRCLALEKNYDFGIISPEKFKGKDFLSLDFGIPPVGGASPMAGPEGGPPSKLPEGIMHYYAEKEIWHPQFLCDVRDYDVNLLNIEDHTKIEGYFQSEKLISKYKKNIIDWLKVHPKFDRFELSNENICVLNVRGGEYRGNKSLELPRKYWHDAMSIMKKIRTGMEFVVVTDDIPYAQKLLPNLKAYHDNIGSDYAMVKNAHYLIISNSSFSFFPAFTAPFAKKIIAPKYWARHNVSDGFWACGFNIYSNFSYIDRSGIEYSAEECQREYDHYKIKHRVSEWGGRPIDPPPSPMAEKINHLKTKLSKQKRKIFDKLGIIKVNAE